MKISNRSYSEFRDDSCLYFGRLFRAAQTGNKAAKRANYLCCVSASWPFWGLIRKSYFPMQKVICIDNQLFMKIGYSKGTYLAKSMI